MTKLQAVREAVIGAIVKMHPAQKEFLKALDSSDLSKMSVDIFPIGRTNLHRLYEILCTGK